MKASWAQILAVVIGVVSASMFAYVNFFAQQIKTEDTKGTVVPSASVPLTSFRLGKPKRTPSDDELKKAIEFIDQSYGLKDAKVAGGPIVVSPYSSEAERLVLGYEV